MFPILVYLCHTISCYFERTDGNAPGSIKNNITHCWKKKWLGEGKFEVIGLALRENIYICEDANAFKFFEVIDLALRENIFEFFSQ